MSQKKLPLLLIAGLLDDHELWAHQIRHLADVCEPIVVDNGRDLTMRALAERVLATVGGSFAVAGMSMGGYAALEVMRLAPERVNGLGLVNTSARSDDEARRRFRMMQIEKARTGGFEELLATDVPSVVHPDRHTDQQLMNAIFAMARRTGATTFIRQHEAIMTRIDSRALLPNIQCPTLVVVGREDTATPLELAEEMAGAIPNAKLGLIEQCGHYSPMERPQAVTALMRLWLAEISARKSHQADPEFRER